MNKFKKDSECIKCGESGASIRWEAGEEKIFDRERMKRKECIKRECQVCHYVWKEQPLKEDEPYIPTIQEY